MEFYDNWGEYSREHQKLLGARDSEFPTYEEIDNMFNEVNKGLNPDDEGLVLKQFFCNMILNLIKNSSVDQAEAYQNQPPFIFKGSNFIKK